MRTLGSLGLGAAPGVGLGYVTSSPGLMKASVAVGVASAIYNTPKVKAKLAIIAHHLQKQGIELSPGWALMNIGLGTAERTGVTERVLEQEYLEGFGGELSE